MRAWILVKSIRARHLTLEDALAALDKVRRRVIHADRAIREPRILELAVTSHSSAYDSEYVALAEMRYTKLVTVDQSFPQDW